ncbi:hypothetical protein [Actinophytocola sp.]|uniref:hypothetical protein n=1 Tax=Actinophytocola sp. TaxID=1872138 RepID=UPI002ED4C9FF
MNSKPATLITSVVLIFIQAALNAMVGLFSIVDITERMDHNQTVTTDMYVFAYGSLAGGVLLAVSGVLLLRGVATMRIVVTVLEGLVIIGGFMSLIAGVPTAVIGIGIAVTILVLLFGKRSSEWFASRRDARSMI